jgi:hypothetical protein
MENFRAGPFTHRRFPLAHRLLAQRTLFRALPNLLFFTHGLTLRRQEGKAAPADSSLALFSEDGAADGNAEGQVQAVKAKPHIDLSQGETILCLLDLGVRQK